MRRRFAEDPALPRLFARLRPGACRAAFEDRPADGDPDGDADADGTGGRDGGRDGDAPPRLLGALAIARGGADAWDLSRADFAAAWGPIRGPLRLARHRAAERLASGPATHLAAFWVDPEARGRGIGSALLAALCAAEPGPITLLARPGREAFYRRHGFREGGPWRLRIIGRLAGMTAMERPAPAGA